MGDLKVDKASAQKAGQNLSDAVEDYKNFGDKPFKEEISMLNSMNADFTEHFKTILKNINDTNATIIKDLEGAAKKAIEIVDKFEEVDDKAKNQMNSKK